jgi:solute carrier family 25 protein 34/35
MYNQAPNSIGPDGLPRGLLYKNPIDCLYKTWQAEGVRGWYKGTTAHLARIAPHTVRHVSPYFHLLAATD